MDLTAFTDAGLHDLSAPCRGSSCPAPVGKQRKFSTRREVVL